MDITLPEFDAPHTSPRRRARSACAGNLGAHDPSGWARSRGRRVRRPAARSLAAMRAVIRLGVAAAVVACAMAPAGARAQSAAAVSMTFKVPAGWSQAAGLAPGEVYFLRVGDTLHTLIVRSLPPKTSDVHAYAAEQMDIEQSRGAEVLDEGATQICDGEPAHRWTVRSASTGILTETHFLTALVTGGVAIVSYAHQGGVGDRRDALDAMTNVCPGPVANPVPAGWPAAKNRYGTTLTAESPDGTSTFIASYRVLGTSRYDVFERDNMPRGDVLADHVEPCAGAAVRRIDVQVRGQIAEVALGLLHGIAYRYAYTRPAKHAADPAAERALTAFCRAGPPLPAGSSEPV
jgi:hypothetical protein